MSRATFLHTADFHLSRPFGFLPTAIAEERRRDQRKTLARIADLAVERDVDYVLIAGDLFDRTRPDPSDIEAVTSAFIKLHENGKQVFVIPGNHDYYSASSIWSRLHVDGVHIFVGPEYTFETLEETGISIGGIAFNPKDSKRRAFENMEVAPDFFTILLTHASYEVFQGQIEEYHPFSAAELEHVPAVYVALGHYHRFNTIDSGKVKACYPGSPEGLGFDQAETGERYVVIGKVADDGQVEIEPVQINTRLVYSSEIDCTSFESVDTLHERLRNICKQNAIVNVRLTGTPGREILHAIDEIAERFKESCYYLSVDTSGLVSPIEQFSEDRTMLGMFRKYMIDQITKAEDPERQRLLRRALDLGLAAFEKE